MRPRPILTEAVQPVPSPDNRPHRPPDRPPPPPPPNPQHPPQSNRTTASELNTVREKSHVEQIENLRFLGILSLAAAVALADHRTLHEVNAQRDPFQKPGYMKTKTSGNRRRSGKAGPNPTVRQLRPAADRSTHRVLQALRETAAAESGSRFRR